MARSFDGWRLIFWPFDGWRLTPLRPSNMVAQRVGRTEQISRHYLALRRTFWRHFSAEEPWVLEWTRTPSDACGRANSIWIRYVWTGKFLNPERKSCGFKNIAIGLALRGFKITLLPLLITSKTPVTTSNGTILTFWHLARVTSIVRLKRPYLFESYNQHWMPMSAVRSCYFIRIGFPLFTSFYRQFPFETS